MSDDAPQKKQDAGAPAWVMTFADLMSLLMCFFVLLLSFSEMDISKYKQIAGSMREAFGVQRKYKVKDVPKGINIIATEFSAGKPEPTVFNVMEQQTTDVWQLHLKTGQDRKNRDEGEQGKKKGGEKDQSGKSGTTEGRRENKAEQSLKKTSEMVMLPKAEALEVLKAKAAAHKAQAAAKALAKAKAAGQMMQVAENLRAALKDEINGGKLEIETADQRIIIRLQDKASFAAGSVFIRDSFRPVLARVGKVLRTAPGNILVAGHTDNLPFTGDVYRSNWELSAGRAVSVVHELIDEGGLDEKRITVEGKGDTQPLVPNDSPSHRARNRRVEIVLAQGEDLFAESELGSGSVSSHPVAPAEEALPLDAIDVAIPAAADPHVSGQAPGTDPLHSSAQVVDRGAELTEGGARGVGQSGDSTFSHKPGDPFISNGNPAEGAAE